MTSSDFDPAGSAGGSRSSQSAVSPKPGPVAPIGRFLGLPQWEILRWVLAAAGGAWLAAPFLTTNVVGTGDAHWYSLMVGDFVSQWRAGIFPVFVGQSEDAFNGAVLPVRFAPYLQHAAGMLDLVTGRTLSPVELLNGVLFLSYTGAAVTTYATLAAMTRGGARWLALPFAWITVASPAVLALGYTGDLFMSVCTLPYLPLAVHAMRGTFIQPGRSSVGWLAAVLAMLWWCHPPIALWTTLLAALTQLPHLAAVLRRRASWQAWGLGALLFVFLAGFPFVSVGTLGLPMVAADRNLILQYVRESFPAALAPVGYASRGLSDYQLGWNLWLMVLAALVGAIVRPEIFPRVLLAGAGLLLCLVLPVPWLTEHLWRWLPQWAVNATNHWPMQRLCPILAFVSASAGFAAVQQFCDRGRWRWLAACLLTVLGLNWAWLQSDPFLERGFAAADNPAAGPVGQMPENRVLTRYAFTPYPQMPAYFSHGHLDPDLENRLLDRTTLNVLASNRHSLLRDDLAPARATGVLAARPNDAVHVSYTLFDGLALARGRHYALELRFARSDLRGSLVLEGATFSRQYALPDSAVNLTLPLPPESFGTQPSSSPVIPLFTEAPGEPRLSLRFVADPPLPADPADFGRYVLREYDPAQLPVAVSGWLPYRATLTADAPAWLETPRMFLAGYAAKANDREVLVARSPGGLVMIPVEAGLNRVELTYPGPVTLRIAYFVSLVFWTGTVAWLGWSLSRKSRSAAGT